MARCWFFKLSAPGKIIAGRQFHLCGDPAFRFGHKAADVSAAYVQLDADSPQAILPADLGRSLRQGDFRTTD